MNANQPYSLNRADYQITFSPGELLDLDSLDHAEDVMAFLHAGFEHCAEWCHITGGRWSVFDRYRSELTVTPKRQSITNDDEN